IRAGFAWSVADRAAAAAADCSYPATAASPPVAAASAKCLTRPGRGSLRTVTSPGRGSLRPPAASRCSARKLAARSFPRRPPAYELPPSYGPQRPNARGRHADGSYVDVDVTPPEVNHAARGKSCHPSGHAAGWSRRPRSSAVRVVAPSSEGRTASLVALPRQPHAATHWRLMQHVATQTGETANGRSTPYRTRPARTRG